jgi:hypothetical protein
VRRALDQMLTDDEHGSDIENRGLGNRGLDTNVVCCGNHSRCLSRFDLEENGDLPTE